MRCIPLTALFTMLAGCSAKPADDHQLLQGRWQIVSQEDEGKEVPAETFQGIEFRFAGDTMTFVNDGKKELGNVKFTLNSAASPKQMDFAQAIETETRIVQAIYDLNGDTLTLCRANNGEKPRPASFSPADRSGISILVLKRVK